LREKRRCATLESNCRFGLVVRADEGKSSRILGAPHAPDQVNGGLDVHVQNDAIDFAAYDKLASGLRRRRALSLSSNFLERSLNDAGGRGIIRHQKEFERCGCSCGHLSDNSPYLDFRGKIDFIRPRTRLTAGWEVLWYEHR